MAEYLSPGVYIEEIEMGAKPIEGVSTSTVGFVGKGFNIKTFDMSIITKLTSFSVLTDETDDLTSLRTSIENAKTQDNIDTLKTAFEILKTIVESASSEDQKKISKYFSLIEEKVIKVEKLFELTNKPVFVSSWADYKNKFGINSFSGDTASEGFLAPAIYSFFANGGKRCYVVSTLDLDDASITGTITSGVRTGLTCFEEIDEVSIICAPGITSSSVQLKIIEHCENMKDRFAILDSTEADDFDSIQTRKNSLVSDSGIAALYYPWIKTSIEVESDENKIALKNIFIPPSGAVAGIYARSDNERGVHKAPANEIVRGALSLKVNITKGEQDILNPKNINCIRAMNGMGIRVWGARTISSDPLWKYVNVRRLFLYLEESIDESTQWVVFEPNNEQLWKRVEQTINNFLLGVWKSGALMGNSPEEAFFVKCDNTTMTADDIANGRLVVNIGVAPTKPAEFVIFRIGQLTASSNS